MTRQEIQQWCIEEYDILIKKYGEEHIYMDLERIERVGRQ